MPSGDSLTIVIPARNEMFLKNTIDDILKNMRGDTNVIAVLDGLWAEPPIDDHPKVSLIYHNEAIGQRAATNEAVRMAKSKFVMKCDGHCMFDEGFDVKLMAKCEYDWTVIPTMKNLHAFNWKCLQCGNETYQGPTPVRCEKCNGPSKFERKMTWQPRKNTSNSFMRFDSDLKFQYWGGYKERPEAKGDFVECMSLIGACFFMHRDRYWELEGMDEGHGGWGQMGTEVACKAWLSGGKLIANRTTWFAHMFRTQGGDFSFPYHISGRDVDKARKYSNDIWKNNKWPKQKYPLSWMLKKFWPIPGWEEKDFQEQEAREKENAAPFIEIAKTLTRHTKGIVYYTDNQLDETIANAVRKRLERIAKERGMKIVSVSLAPLDFGKNFVLPLERGVLTMTTQILRGLMEIDTDIVYFAEHDLLYHQSHFDFIPSRDDAYYYNENTWKVRSSDGQAVFFHTKQTSGCCAYRRLLLQHYQRRVERITNEGFSRSMGYEPGCHQLPTGVDNYPAREWMSEHPNVDIRHASNLTWSRFKPEQYRSQKSIRGWTLADEVPFWGKTKGRFGEFLQEAIDK